MSNRELNDWITAYLKYTENTEPPVSYHTWIGISIIAAALERKTYFRWGYDTIYPNMYVVLVGPSGKARKGTAIGIGKEILNELKITSTSESTTREALIRHMAENLKSFQDTDDDMKVKLHSSLTAISEELSVFLGQNDIKFLADLTDWYDSRDSWTYQTKTAGTDEIMGVCFNLLGATAPEWLSSILPEEAIGGGFTSRIIFVVEEDKGKIVPEHILTEEEKKLNGMLKRDLQRINLMKGQFHFSNEARLAYVSWYTKDQEDASKDIKAVDDPKFNGYCERRATHIRKLCMIISASRSDSKLIEIEDFNRSFEILKRSEMKMPSVFGGIGKSLYASITENILTFIRQRGTVKRSSLMKRFYRDVDMMTLKTVEDILSNMKVIKIVHKTDKGEITYVYTGPK